MSTFVDFDRMRRELYSAAIGDVLDAAGRLNQFLPPAIRPLAPGMVVAGRAMPVLLRDIADPERALAAARAGLPSALMLAALDDLRPGDVYLATGSSGYATWGELMSTRAMKLGAAGAVIHGYSRDTRAIVELGFQAFSWGPYARDQRPRGEVVDFRIAVDVEGVRIEAGDLVFGDIDGVVVVPRAIEEDVLRLAFERAAGESKVRAAFRDGATAADAVARYGLM